MMTFLAGVWNAFLWGMLIAGSVVGFIAGVAVIVLLTIVVCAFATGMFEAWQRDRRRRGL